ncbi:hypothetical protein EXIGLDRAFT_694195 [Exidia glandulosa HHB12029]|uniref:Uncharacterized protein n=1 Tax=Exidia glandulosa HHB12029 TaxID=1314781 RepID=A0A165GRZ6_EXIGL|nr:hypothetical protein EXIGLDRAFT_694195 [Exidia glandulosa HHB12029]
MSPVPTAHDGADLCWDNTYGRVPGSCRIWWWEDDLPRCPDGAPTDILCQGPWPKNCCPVQDHQAPSRVLKDDPQVFGAYLDDTYVHKMEMLKIEEQQRVLGAEQARGRKEDLLAVRWYKKGTPAPIRVQVPHPGSRFHPKDCLVLVRALELTEDSLFELYDKQTKSWFLSSFHTAGVDVSKVKEVFCRDYGADAEGVESAAPLPTPTSSPLKRRPPPDAPTDLRSPKKAATAKASSSSIVIDIEELETGTDVFGPIQHAPAHDSPSQSNTWPVTYSAMASALAVANLLMNPEEEGATKASGQQAFGAAFPKMAAQWLSKHSTFYKYLRAWAAAPDFLRDRYAGDPSCTWSAFMKECLKKIPGGKDKWLADGGLAASTLAAANIPVAWDLVVTPDADAGAGTAAKVVKVLRTAFSTKPELAKDLELKCAIVTATELVVSYVNSDDGEEEHLDTVLFTSHSPRKDWKPENSEHVGYTLDVDEVLDFLQSPASGLELDLSARFRTREPKSGGDDFPVVAGHICVIHRNIEKDIEYLRDFNVFMLTPFLAERRWVSDHIRTAATLEEFLRGSNEDSAWDSPSEYENDYNPATEVARQATPPQREQPPATRDLIVVSPPRKKNSRPGKKTEQEKEAARRRKADAARRTTAAYLARTLGGNRYVSAVRNMADPKARINARHLAKFVQAVGKVLSLPPQDLRSAGVKAGRITLENMAEYLGRSRKWVREAYEAYPLQGLLGPGGNLEHEQITDVMTNNDDEHAYGMKEWLRRLQIAEFKASEAVELPRKRVMRPADMRKPGRRTKVEL